MGLSLSAWVQASRPKTLTAAVVPVTVGAALAYAVHHHFEPLLTVLALLCTLLIQVGTNLINDALDFEKGADTEERLGPQRVTQSGVLEAKWVFRFGLLCFLASIILAIPLVIVGGWPLVAIGVMSLIAGYAYTGGPYPLAYVGLGDPFVLLFFGWVAVGGVYFLNSSSWAGSSLAPTHLIPNWIASWVAGSQVGLLATVLIAINNLRDRETDLKANKKTLAVRLGERFVQVEILFLSFLPFLLGAYWFQTGLKWAALLPWALFPLALRLVRRVWSSERGVVFNTYLAQAAAIHLAFGVLLSLGFVLGPR